MGETPQAVKIACPGCETQFRLKPKKGRLPEGPLPCPKCGESIPIVEENIRRGDPDTQDPPSCDSGSSAPQAHVFNKAERGEPDETRKSTALGSPAKTPHRSDAIDVDDEFDHIDAAPGLAENNPKSTFLGMGSALQAVQGPGASANRDKTAVVDGDILAKMRSESSVVEDDEPDDEATGQDSKQNVFDRETSETKAISSEVAALTASKTKKAPSLEQAQKTKKQQAPGQMVLGKIKIKKKLKRTTKAKSDKNEAGVRAPSKPAASEATTKVKPSLSTLLAKAREKKEEFNLPSPEEADKSTGDLDRALDELADETARTVANRDADEDVDGGAPAYDSEDSSMIDLLRRRVAENQQPGAAGERRGSGYIRLPTAEIQDVLGQGTYRLRVEDIVYEPIDKEGLTQLVKRGVLLGAEEIAEPDGDWMPIADHPVFLELRRKMAREAHDLLKKYGQPASSDATSPASETKQADHPAGRDDAALPAPKAELPAPTADVPASTTELPGRVDELPVSTAVGFEMVDEDDQLEPDLEKEAEQAAKELFADDVATEADADAPPPMPAAQEPGDAIAADQGGGADEASIEVDYDALRGRVDDVKGAATAPHSTDEAAPPSGRSGSMRTWIPLIGATAVLATLVLVAVSPFGRPYLDGLFTSGPAADEQGAASPDDQEDERAEQTEQLSRAIADASTMVAGAVDVDTDDPTVQQRVAEQLADSGDYAGASRVMSALWAHRADDADFAARYADVLLEAGHFTRARRVAIDGMQLGSDTHDFSALFTRAVEENPALQADDVVDISTELADAADVEMDDQKAVLHLSNGDTRAYTFEPSQDGGEDEWRSSVASYRLCQIIVCNFEVPRTRTARIDKTTFGELTGSKQASAAAKLIWVREDGTEYAYGALQDAVEAPASFPVEDTDLWRDWLNAASPFDGGTTPADEALAPLQHNDAGFYAPLAAQLDQTTLERLARQLSSVFVFDFLTNNWERFASDPSNWGAHLHAADGTLVSLKNTGAFQPRASTRVRGRFGWSSRYSRDTIDSLRLITPELVSEKLFPDASPAERAKLRVFWSQRDAALEHVDQLVGTHGDKDVLAFQ